MRQENKIIAEKLDSLDSLPDGYHPNFNSKWALIEESLDKRSVLFTSKFWIRVAACLLLLITTTITWKYFNSNTQTVVQHQPEQIPPGKNNYVVPVSVAEVKMKNKKSLLEIIIPDSNQKSTGNITPFISEDVIPEEVSEACDVNESIIVNREPLKKNRRRYVQVDFDAPVNNGSPPDEVAQSLRLKFGTKPSDNQTQEITVNSSSLKIRKNF